jgi:Spy/CpxP family protein refolding chaperone
MARLFAWAFAALLMLPAAGFAGECDRGQDPSGRASQPGHSNGRGDPNHQPPKFWVDPKLRAELGITDQQSSAIESIWQTGFPQRAEARDKLDKLEAQLDQMMREASGDEAAIVALIDRVEAARSEVSKARVLMLYRINKVLRPEQRAKLAEKAKAMRDQRDGRGDHR